MLAMQRPSQPFLQQYAYQSHHREVLWKDKIGLKTHNGEYAVSRDRK